MSSWWLRRVSVGEWAQRLTSQHRSARRQSPRTMSATSVRASSWAQWTSWSCDLVSFECLALVNLTNFSTMLAIVAPHSSAAARWDALDVLEVLRKAWTVTCVEVRDVVRRGRVEGSFVAELMQQLRRRLTLALVCCRWYLLLSMRHCLVDSASMERMARRFRSALLSHLSAMMVILIEKNENEGKRRFFRTFVHFVVCCCAKERERYVRKVPGSVSAIWCFCQGWNMRGGLRICVCYFFFANEKFPKGNNEGKAIYFINVDRPFLLLHLIYISTCPSAAIEAVRGNKLILLKIKAAQERRLSERVWSDREKVEEMSTLNVKTCYSLLKTLN